MACTFSYTLDDLALTLPPQGNDIDEVCVPKTIDKERNTSNTNDVSVCCSKMFVDGHKFDNLLCKLWDEAQIKGYFNYVYGHVPCQILGQYGYIVQLNTDRAEKRRDPQRIQSLSQPFNPAEFNFTKVKSEEILFELKPWYSTVSDEESNDSKPNSESLGHKIVINVSPLEYGNILLVPFLNSLHPQRVTKEALRLALDLLLLSRSSHFRMGFNSLCAYASVNHLHFHGYYLIHRLYLEHSDLKNLKGPLYETANYPAPGFVFVLDDLSDEESLKTFVENSFKLINYLQLNEIPHNLYMTRGSTQAQLGHFDSVRLFVWARSPSYGAKVSNAFNPAVCELAGHVVVKTEGAYEEINEDMISKELEDITVEIFQKIRDNVSNLYSTDELQNSPNSSC